MDRPNWISAMLQHSAKTFPARYAEWALALITLSWGLVLLRSVDTFAISPSFAGLARIAPEWAWGFGCVAIGGIRLAALAINGLWVPSTYHLRAATSFMSIFIWFQITLGVVAATGFTSTAIAVYPWLLVLDFVCLYRVARDNALFQGSQRAGVHGAGH